MSANAAGPWYDPDHGVIRDRGIFSDPDIYQQELERIFARAWNFVCHETQIPDPGCFFMSYIGEDEVIVVRDRNQRVQVLLNSCPHRGNTVCRAEFGRTSSFLCSYHGWISPGRPIHTSRSDQVFTSVSARPSLARKRA